MEKPASVSTSTHGINPSAEYSIAKQDCFSIRCIEQLGDLRMKLSALKTTADSSALSADSALLQCETMVKQMKEKNLLCLEELKARAHKLGEQFDHLQSEFCIRECAETQLQDEVSQIERQIMEALAKDRANECENFKVSIESYEKIDEILKIQDNEMASLVDDLTALTFHWKLKARELESQLEKNHKADQEMKKKVVNIDFSLREARAEVAKFQQNEEKRYEAIIELKDLVAAKKQTLLHSENNRTVSFWERSGFKIVITMSMLVFVLFSNRKHLRVM